MRSHVFGLLLVGATLALAPEARADRGDSGGNVTRAAAEYEAGRQAYKERRFAEAGEHFELAFAEVPSAQALRNAIRARREARELDRAASLAALAEKQYAGDAPTMVLVREVLSEASPRFARLDITCAPACTVKVDGTTVSIGDAADEHSIFVKSGPRSVEARFSGKGGKVQAVEPKAGSREELKFEPEDDGGSSSDKKDKDSKGDKSDKADKGDKKNPPSEDDAKPFPKGVFYGGVAVSVLMAGLTVGSYLDLKRVEGEEIAVAQQCKDEGQDTDCYPTGEVSAGARSRTYIVLGLTGAFIAGTAAIGLWFTRWGSKDPAPQRSGNSRLEPYAVPLRGGAAFGVGGRF